MTVKLTAIVKGHARLDAGQLNNQVDRTLRDFAVKLINKMAKYPPQQPTTYRRTGSLGRGWDFVRRAPGTVDVVNRVSYAVYVEGPGPGEPGTHQSKVMARKGWPSVTVTADKLIKEEFPKLQRAVRLEP